MIRVRLTTFTHQSDLPVSTIHDTIHLCHIELQPLPMAYALTPPPHCEEGDGDSCSICFEAWTTAGEHRLSALRCGHIFGFTCIQRWLKAQGSAAKCPQVSRSPGFTLGTESFPMMKLLNLTLFLYAFL